MNTHDTALLLVGFQNDYFSTDGVLRRVIEDSANTDEVLLNTVQLIRSLHDTDLLMLQTPTLFSPDYGELNNPVGLLKAIREFKALQPGQPGSELVAEIAEFGDRVQVVQGKDCFNAFSNTGLAAVLSEHGIRNLVIAGAIISIGIDSTGRSAHENGYVVTVLSDCTCGRTDFEQQFYCEQILPLYAEVETSDQLVARLR